MVQMPPHISGPFCTQPLPFYPPSRPACYRHQGITDHCPLPNSCHRLYLTGAIYKVLAEDLMCRRAVLGGGCLR
jgi:hypothetical protein